MESRVAKLRCRLIVGGGRKFGHGAADLSLNTDPAARPSILGDMAKAPIRAASIREVLFERVPAAALTRSNAAALREAARVLRSDGRLVIEGVRDEPSAELVEALESLGFRILLVSRGSRVRIEARRARA